MVAEACLGKPQCERDESLLGAVVQVALDPAAFRIARVDDRDARGGEFLSRLGVCDRLCQKVGEVAEPDLASGGESSSGAGGRGHRSPVSGDLDRCGDGRSHSSIAKKLRGLARDPSRLSTRAGRPVRRTLVVGVAPSDLSVVPIGRGRAGGRPQAAPTSTR
jgi:hypothetical protein